MRRKDILTRLIKRAYDAADTARVRAEGDYAACEFSILPEDADVCLHEIERLAKEANEYVDIVIIFDNGEKIHEEVDFRNDDINIFDL